MFSINNSMDFKKIDKMRVLIACEYSGTVRDAFKAKGHYAMSVDLLPTDVPGEHHQGDVLEVLNDGWDLMIAHPPCTYLTLSANAWLKDQPPLKSGKLVGAERRAAVVEAADFFMKLVNAPIKKIAIENPKGIMNRLYRQPDQTIQPWMFGHPEKKGTCLWLKNLPKLIPTNNVYDAMVKLPKKEQEKIHYMSPGPERWKLRSTTYSGIAEAMADQWG